MPEINIPWIRTTILGLGGIPPERREEVLNLCIERPEVARLRTKAWWLGISLTVVAVVAVPLLSMVVPRPDIAAWFIVPGFILTVFGALQILPLWLENRLIRRLIKDYVEENRNAEQEEGR